MQSNFDQLLLGEAFIFSFFQKVEQRPTITQLHQGDNNPLIIPTNDLPTKELHNMFTLGQHTHNILFLFGLSQPFLSLADDSFKRELFLGPGVFCQPDESESPLWEQLQLIYLSSSDGVLLGGVGVVLLWFVDLLLDGVFDFVEHVLEVGEHPAFLICFNYLN